MISAMGNKPSSSLEIGVSIVAIAPHCPPVPHHCSRRIALSTMRSRLSKPAHISALKVCTSSFTALNSARFSLRNASKSRRRADTSFCKPLSSVSGHRQRCRCGELISAAHPAPIPRLAAVTIATLFEFLFDESLILILFSVKFICCRGDVRADYE